MANTKITSDNLDTLTTLTVDDITIDGSTISDAGDLTLDVGGDITLDAAGQQIIFASAGTNVSQIDMAGTDLEIKSLVNNADLFIRGTDGGSEITALTFDMSEAGKAIFNSDLTIGNAAGSNQTLQVTNDNGNFQLQKYSDDVYLNLNDNGSIIFRHYGSSGSSVSQIMSILPSGNVGIGTASPVKQLTLAAANTSTVVATALNHGASNYWGVGSFTDQSFRIAKSHGLEDANTYFAINRSNGNVGIATTSPSAQLSVVGNSLTNVSTTGIPAIRAQGGYGGGIGLLDTKEAGWYAQDNGDTLYQYVGRTVGSDTPASKVIMTYKSSGKVGIGETTPDDTLHVNASGGTARLRIGSGNDAYYTSKGYLGDTWYFGSGETGDVVTSTISGGAFTSSNAGGAFVWKTDNSGTLSEKMRIRSDGVVTTPEQCYFLAVRTSNLSGYNFAAVSGAVTPIFTSIVSAQSSASGTAAFSTTDGTFSAPVDGLYLFHISFYSNVTIEQAWLTANGGRISYTDMVANTNASYTTGVFSASIQYYMTAGSSIRIHPYSSGSTSDYVYDNAYHTYWKGVLLG